MVHIYFLPTLKYATLVHVMCNIISLMIEPYLPQAQTFALFIQYSQLITTLLVSVAISIKVIELFQRHHRYFMQQYSYVSIIIESLIAVGISIIFMMNQAITGKFITYIAHISQQTHNHTISITILFIFLFFALHLYELFFIKKSYPIPEIIHKTIGFNLFALFFKITIIVATALGYINPMTQLLAPFQLLSFDNLIFHFTTTKIFLYIHTIIMILLGIWIIMGIYYGYQYYKNLKK